MDEHSSKVICSHCGSEAKENATFCAKCGGRVEVAKHYCYNCGGAVQPMAKFCPVCGVSTAITSPTPIAYPKNKRPVAAPVESPSFSLSAKKELVKIIAVVLAIVVGIAGVVAISAIKTKRATAVTEYQQNVSAFYKKVLVAGTKLEKIGNETKNYWRAYVYSESYNWEYAYSVDQAIENAHSYASAVISEARELDSEIKELYEALSDIPNGRKNQNLEDVFELVEKVYDAYQEMYDYIMDPTGNYTHFLETFDETYANLLEALNDLKPYKNSVESEE